MSGHVGVGGAWKDIVNGTAVGVGGVWKTVEKMWVGVGGAWKVFFENAVFDAGADGLYEDVDNFAIGTAQVQISYNNAGQHSIDALTNGDLDFTNWVAPTSAAPGSYQIRLTVNSGSAPALGSAATGVDLALTSTRVWAWNRTSPGFTSANVTVELKDGGGNVIASATFDIAVTV